MNAATTIPGFRRLRAELPGPVGFVPTMGYLHDGHLSLVHRAREECTSVVASVFVNPAQFAPGEDLANYPRDIDRDVALLEEAGTDVVFLPSVESLYPDGYDTWVDVERLTERLEGADRPTHFRGVATIVVKLFHLVRPARAYFGQKDAQQALVIRRLIRDLDFDICLVVCPTVRESDGLAMSSRNAYLAPQERRAATVLYRCLERVEALYASGERDAGRLLDEMRTQLRAEPLARLAYASIADVEDLAELETVDRKALVSLAVRIGKTRLIDNTILPPGQRLV
jgi:pantoate--beta-alanine ligase